MLKETTNLIESTFDFTTICLHIIGVYSYDLFSFLPITLTSKVT